LDIPELSEAASAAHVFPDMANHDLLSVCQMSNEEYVITFWIDGVTINNSAGKAILEWQRDLDRGLWRINLRPDKPWPTIDASNNVNDITQER
jgi:hypothetical protein